MCTTKNEYTVYHTEGIWETIKEILPLRLEELEAKLENTENALVIIQAENEKLRTKNDSLEQLVKNRDCDIKYLKRHLADQFEALRIEYRKLLIQKDQEINSLRARLEVPPPDAPPGPVGAQNASACYTVYGL